MIYNTSEHFKAQRKRKEISTLQNFGSNALLDSDLAHHHSSFLCFPLCSVYIVGKLSVYSRELRPSLGSGFLLTFASVSSCQLSGCQLLLPVTDVFPAVGRRQFTCTLANPVFLSAPIFAFAEVFPLLVVNCNWISLPSQQISSSRSP